MMKFLKKLLGSPQVKRLLAAGAAGAVVLVAVAAVLTVQLRGRTATGSAMKVEETIRLAAEEAEQAALASGAAARGVPETTAAPTAGAKAAQTEAGGASGGVEGDLAAAAQNSTGNKPEVNTPADWNEAGKALMARLKADPAGAGLNLNAQSGQPYLAAVNRAASVVTIYTADENGEYTVPYMAMACSGGEDTPLGFFATTVSYPWRLLSGPCYGQYATRIVNSYLFHSVPYYTQHKDNLEYDQFNQLGTPASLGCIRLAVVDVKWIYDNCPLGLPVLIYDDAANPGPMGRPGTIATDPTEETLRGWDPTDPDPANPWAVHFRSGTALRSAAALAEWNDAQKDSRWQQSLTPAELRGSSTDSKKEGTRG